MRPRCRGRSSWRSAACVKPGGGDSPEILQTLLDQRAGVHDDEKNWDASLRLDRFHDQDQTLCYPPLEDLPREEGGGVEERAAGHAKAGHEVPASERLDCLRRGKTWFRTPAQSPASEKIILAPLNIKIV